MDEELTKHVAQRSAKSPRAAWLSQCINVHPSFEQPTKADVFPPATRMKATLDVCPLRVPTCSVENMRATLLAKGAPTRKTCSLAFSNSSREQLKASFCARTPPAPPKQFHLASKKHSQVPMHLPDFVCSAPKPAVNPTTCRLETKKSNAFSHSKGKEPSKMLKNFANIVDLQSGLRKSQNMINHDRLRQTTIWIKVASVVYAL